MNKLEIKEKLAEIEHQLRMVHMEACNDEQYTDEQVKNLDKALTYTCFAIGDFK